ncbi:hypothetical protein HBH61_156150 [Parastagonospora nodorum]|nr:hypothetical protein HBI09_195570 [Parastagonospora nodorum]KAH4218961.1 hypothetical protein HBI06_191940 [Parastagonospora nodorum]KAH4235471.1 hypothetical protein HBI05_148670 [Parastagonospora nodorum]KAH4805751.1 hypothetical protein HBH61_156150 [Parastagonospora nodorum]KAH4999190.1 hypothetical protein HBI77_176070 [Parastagonospora nodorum]
MLTNRTLQDSVHDDDLDSIQRILTGMPPDQAQCELDAGLALAMPKNSLATIEHLLRLGAKLNNASFDAAFAREETAVFKLLIDSGWDINSSPSQLNGLYYALESENLLRWLLEHGANPNVISPKLPGSCSHPGTPLMDAAELSDPTALRTLIAHGATLHPEILFYAIGLRHNSNGTATMEALIEHGADINYVSPRRSTPLYAAVRVCDEEKIRFLLARGADPHLKVADGHLSALEYARRLGRTHLVSIMEAAGGDSAP